MEILKTVHKVNGSYRAYINGKRVSLVQADYLIEKGIANRSYNSAYTKQTKTHWHYFVSVNAKE